MGWLFGNKDNSRTETKTVNDNGKLKELQLTITGPDSTMVVTGDEYRTTVPLRGNRPVAAEEVLIEKKAPNGMWLNSLIPFYDGDVQGTQKKARSLWQLPAVDGKSQGGWLNKFQNGGTAQPSQEQVMKELMAIVQQAATELQSNKLGLGVQTLAQIANDPQGSQLLDTLVQQVPEAGQIVEAVMKMVGAFKCGGKAKKKVKKGAKGCVPCKKLMKVGGKLINVLTDCEGNIISKHQAGGWLIPKGYNGLLTDKLVADKYRTVNTGTATEGAEHYYIADDGSLRRQYAVSNDQGGFDWAYLNLNQDLNHEGFNKWLSGTVNNDTGERIGGVSDFWSNGVNYNNGAITFNNETTAKGILGEEEYNKGAITGKSVHGVSKSGNTWLGDKVEDLNVTGQDYVQHHGGWQNAMQAEDNILKAKRRASRKLAREQRQNMRDLYRDFDGNISIDLDGEGGNDAVSFTNKRDARQAIRNSRQGYMKEARQARTANLTAILGTLAPLRGTISQNSLKMQTTSGSTTLPSNDVIRSKKQGGWLTKFN